MKALIVFWLASLESECDDAQQEWLTRLVYRGILAEFFSDFFLYLEMKNIILYKMGYDMNSDENDTKFQQIRKYNNVSLGGGDSWWLLKSIYVYFVQV